MAAGKTTPRETVWFMAKPGEERRYASPREPSPERAAALKKEGYRIFRIKFRMDPNWDSADFETNRTEVTEMPEAPKKPKKSKKTEAQTFRGMKDVIDRTLRKP